MNELVERAEKREALCYDKAGSCRLDNLVDELIAALRESERTKRALSQLVEDYRKQRDDAWTGVDQQLEAERGRLAAENAELKAIIRRELGEVSGA